jgi:transketolase
MELLSRVHARNFAEFAKDKPEILVLSADLTSNTEIDLFRDAYPDRFIAMGMTEQDMHSFAGGLAREGFVPYIHTFAVFIYRRALDQISMSIAYPNMRVRMFGFLPGIMTPGGATHQAIDDIGVLRVLPNMTILETGDATEVEQVLPIAHAVDGPVYVRQLRGEVPRLFDPSETMELGKSRCLSIGKDIALFSSGICTEEALRATCALVERGVSIHHLHVSTHKPFNDPAVIEAAANSRYGVITMENHTVIGGLGTEVAEVMAENAIGKKLVRIGLPDSYAHGASKQYLMREYGLDALALVEKVEALVGEKLDITADDLDQVRLETMREAKAEAL